MYIPLQVGSIFQNSALTSPIDLLEGIPIVVVTPQEQYQDPRIPELFLRIVAFVIVHLGIKNSVFPPPSFSFPLQSF